LLQLQPKESNVYVVPLIALALIVVIAAVWSPIFAFVIAVPAFVLFLAYVGLSRRADQKAPRASGAPASGEGAPAGGIWGEKSNS
jgi:ABC-type transport system involved in cytochrome bd biosynthesis fused ATPase/permease subunit